jgi:hypothetical protein
MNSRLGKGRTGDQEDHREEFTLVFNVESIGQEFSRTKDINLHIESSFLISKE